MHMPHARAEPLRQTNKTSRFPTIDTSHRVVVRIHHGSFAYAVTSIPPRRLTHRVHTAGAFESLEHVVDAIQLHITERRTGCVRHGSRPVVVGLDTRHTDHLDGNDVPIERGGPTRGGWCNHVATSDHHIYSVLVDKSACNRIRTVAYDSVDESTCFDDGRTLQHGRVVLGVGWSFERRSVVAAHADDKHVAELLAQTQKCDVPVMKRVSKQDGEHDHHSDLASCGFNPFRPTQTTALSKCTVVSDTFATQRVLHQDEDMWNHSAPLFVRPPFGTIRQMFQPRTVVKTFDELSQMEVAQIMGTSGIRLVWRPKNCANSHPPKLV